jgi:hypothetical protein
MPEFLPIGEKEWRNSVQNAKIEAYNTADDVTVTVITSIQINNFTVKVTNIKNGVQAQYGRIVLNNDSIVHEGNIYYVVHLVGTSTHTFVIEDKA